MYSRESEETAKMLMLRKIFKELVKIRKELHSIRNAMESGITDADTIAGDIAKKLGEAFSAMNL